MLNMLLRAFFFLVLIVLALSFLVFAFWVLMAILAIYIGYKVYVRFFKKKTTKRHPPDGPTIIDAEIVDTSWKNKH